MMVAGVRKPLRPAPLTVIVPFSKAPKCDYFHLCASDGEVGINDWLQSTKDIAGKDWLSFLIQWGIYAADYNVLCFDIQYS